MIKRLNRHSVVPTYTLAAALLGAIVVAVSIANVLEMRSDDDRVQSVAQQYSELPSDADLPGRTDRARVLPDEQLGEGNNVLLLTFVQVALLLVGGAGIRLLISRPTMKATSNLVVDAELAAIGDLRVMPKQELGNEYGQLQQAFGEMLTSFRQTISRIGHAATDLKAAASEMAHTSDEAGHAIGEVAQAISSISEGAAHQVDLVTRTQQVVAEIEDAIGDASEHAHQSVRQAADADRLADDGVERAAEVQMAMDQVRETSSATASVVRSLGEKSQDIDQIVQAITDIAAQTNLLALNAAIEAARAGEQGRGFAVVAEEVRKLAEDAQGSAASIADLIKQIQAQTEEAVTAMERGVSEVESGTETVNRNRQAFYDISSSVQTLHGGSAKIAELAQSIATGADRVRAQIEEVASVAEQSSASTEQVSASTQQTSAAAQQVTASAQRVEQTAVELAQLAGGFRLP